VRTCSICSLNILLWEDPLLHEKSQQSLVDGENLLLPAWLLHCSSWLVVSMKAVSSSTQESRPMAQWSLQQLSECAGSLQQQQVQTSLLEELAGARATLELRRLSKDDSSG
jgi:hypothetical protein